MIVGPIPSDAAHRFGNAADPRRGTPVIGPLHHRSLEITTSATPSRLLRVLRTHGLTVRAEATDLFVVAVSTGATGPTAVLRLEPKPYGTRLRAVFRHAPTSSSLLFRVVVLVLIAAIPAVSHGHPWLLFTTLAGAIGVIVSADLVLGSRWLQRRRARREREIIERLVTTIERTCAAFTLPSGYRAPARP